MTDRAMVELVLRACDGDEVAFRALLREFGGMLWNEAKRLYAPGLVLDDLLQEARYGLHKATVSFDPSRRVPFGALAQLAVRRQVITAVKAATRGKAGPLNAAIALDSPVVGTDDALLQDILPGGEDPLDVLLGREALGEFVARLACLSALERAAIEGVAQGLTYVEIGALARCNAKAVDNALARVRRKLAA